MSDENDHLDESRGLKRLGNTLNSITDFTDGLGKIFDFSKVHTAGTKLFNIFSVFAIDLVWLFVLIVFLRLLGFGRDTIVNDFMSPLFFSNITGSLPNTLTESPLFLFFLACVMAPLWEEFCFRLAPIKLAQLLSGIAKNTNVQISIVGSTAVAFAIFFGILHGHGSISILIQGVGGLLFCWLYLKNNNSYWSCVAAHSLWNFMVIFGLPAIMD